MTPPKPGRPRLDPEDDSVGVYVTLPGRRYDEAFDRAKQARVSVPEIIRRDMHTAAAKISK